MGKSPCCDKRGLKKGPWTAEEDKQLMDYIHKHGHGRWRTIPKNAGLRRCGKSCRLRWTNYLRPDIKRGRFSFEEEETIIQIHSILGNKWSAIAARLPGRTDNEIKNYWNTHIRRRLIRMGIDPVTHTPYLDVHELYSLHNSSPPNPQNYVLGDHHDPQMANPNVLSSPIDASCSQCNNINMHLVPPNFQENQSTTPHVGNIPFQTFQEFDQISMDQFSVYTTNFINCPNSIQSLCMDNEDQSINSVAHNSLAFQDYYNPDFSKSHLSEISAPSFSSLPSNTSASYVNIGAEDDQRDNYCINGDVFEIPSGLDVDGFM